MKKRSLGFKKAINFMLSGKQFLKFAIGLLLIFSFSKSEAQQKFTINGNVKDARTGEEMFGATVSVKEIPTIGTGTNAYGFYSITLPEGNYNIIAQYVGYEPKIINVNLTSNLKQDFLIGEIVRELNEVVISAEKKNENVSRPQMGIEKLDILEIKNIPVLFGEKDVIKTLQLLPGVKSAGEGNTGFFVRGGGADENLILLDEAPVYSASHLLGFFSVFNSDAIKDATLFKGGMPAEYGGRLASVLDIKMNDGNSNKFGGSGGIGLISSRLNLEGPIVKERGSFMFSGRRTYADVFLKLSKDSSLNNTKLYFYDFNLKTNYRIDSKNRIFLSGYFGNDVLGFGDTFGISWGNATGTLRWNHLFNAKLFSNTSLIYSNYNYQIDIGLGESVLKIKSKIRDFNLKQDFTYFTSNSHLVKFGFNSILHTISPGSITSDNSNDLNNTTYSDRKSWENAVYLSDEWKINSKFNVDFGLRATAYSILKFGEYYNYNEKGNVTDTLKNLGGGIIKTYLNLEPRLSTSYILNETTSLKASYARTTQNIHQLSNTTSGSPTDVWIGSSNYVKPAIADQVSLGYFRNLKENKYEFSTEVYYKLLANQIEYKDGAELNANENVETELVFGKGRAYGIEFLVKKKTGKLTGWVAYTLSKTERSFDRINRGNYFSAKQDRTHEISIVATYELSRKWTLSANWIYNTGNAVTFPTGKYTVDGNVISLYSERNQDRMPASHRLDLGATYLHKKTDKWESSWSFSLYNAYSQQNPYTITFRKSKDNPEKTEAVQTSLFKIIPSVSYNFKF